MKILIIRFSSIGDIVLTTPIVRCVKKQIPQAEIHFLCKSEYKNLVETNPYIQKIHLFDKKVHIFEQLQTENFDYIIDLQNNHRSRKLCRKLKTPHAHFPKLNIQKWLLVNFKINRLPNIHVVDRYFAATKRLPVSVKNDNQGLDFFIENEDYEKINAYNIPQPFITIAMGSRHKTKQLSLPMLAEICKKINHHIVLLGGEEDVEAANYLCSQVGKNSTNLCGKLSLRESAACIDLSKTLLTGDTGLMHIAAARNKPIVSVWGNTVPAFGMYPYMPQCPDNYHIIENTNLKCRPCSKLGFEKCPKKHFKCMNEVDIEQIINLLK
ncbi:MAG: glycosyltransferase family 9 protein [Lentimicrobiaceae bacterium]|nr:glycosyltransferase family 9 protein [Lentimicrobiaceae bacterium]